MFSSPNLIYDLQAGPCYTRREIENNEVIHVVPRLFGAAILIVSKKDSGSWFRGWMYKTPEEALDQVEVVAKGEEPTGWTKKYFD